MAEALRKEKDKLISLSKPPSFLAYSSIITSTPFAFASLQSSLQYFTGVNPVLSLT